MITPNPGLVIAEQPPEALVRMCLWGEARGEGPRGLAAVRWCLHNRSKRYGWTINRVILQPWHFSSFNEGDPNRAKLLTAWRSDPASWGAVDAVCALFEAGILGNEIGDATHYYAFADAAPAWGRGHPEWRERAVIGKHVFGLAA